MVSGISNISPSLVGLDFQIHSNKLRNNAGEAEELNISTLIKRTKEINMSICPFEKSLIFSQ